MAKAKRKVALKEFSPEQPSADADTVFKSFEEFVRERQAQENAKGMRDKHHPDLHYLGADANMCPRCDGKLPPLYAEYSAR